MVQALVLEEKHRLALREIAVEDVLGPREVRIAPKVVGICGSDVHYYTHGAIGDFVVREPMILGHEAAGEIIAIGADVSEFEIGDRVCMEPGIPDPTSRASRLGLYNLDPKVRFWATPPIHGCLRPEVVHPADFTFAIPDHMTYAEAAMMEPLAVGVHAAAKARITPGDIAVVIGAGPIGWVTALAALAGGCAKVFIGDVDASKFAPAGQYRNIETVAIGVESLAERVKAATRGWGADVVFECSGSSAAISGMFDPLRPGGCVVMVGMPVGPVAYDVVKAQIIEARVEHVFRYAHMYPRAIGLVGSGALDVRPLITRTFPFSDSVAAFDYAASFPKGEVKIQIDMPESLSGSY